MLMNSKKMLNFFSKNNAGELITQKKLNSKELLEKYWLLRKDFLFTKKR